MSKNSMNRAFGVTRDDRNRAEQSAELMLVPYVGTERVEVMKATYKEASKDKEGKPIPASIALFCRVPREDGSYDPRPVNLQFMNWNPDSADSFRVKLGHLFRALGTDNLTEMKGRFMLVTLKRKSVDNPRFFHSYLALRTEPIEAQ